MGLPRRQLTKEFKLVAVRRLQQGVSIGEVARALEVDLTVPPAIAFQGTESALAGGADCRVGEEGRPTNVADRFFLGAPHVRIEGAARRI